MDDYKKQFDECIRSGRITRASGTFKIQLFLKKGENSLFIAKSMKDKKPTGDEPTKQYWNYWAITIFYYSMLYCAKAIIMTKGYEVHDHDAAQIALGYLCVPSQIEKEDFELLGQAYKIFEDEYVKYFEDAKTESHIARYSAIQMYTERRLEEIFENARKFVSKVLLILESKP